MLNGYSESPEIKAITQDQAVTGIRHDILGRYPVASDYQNRQNLETQRLKTRSHEVHLTFRRFPTISFKPGALVNLEGGLWSDKIFPKGKVYRVRNMSIEARSVEEEATADHNMTYSRYNLEMTSDSNCWPRLGSNWPPSGCPHSPSSWKAKL